MDKIKTTNDLGSIAARVERLEHRVELLDGAVRFLHKKEVDREYTTADMPEIVRTGRGE